MKTIRGFAKPIHLVAGDDNLRPAMQHVYFEKGVAYATNAHIAIRAKVEAISDGLEQSEIDKLDGKYIYKAKFEKILKAEIIEITDEGVKDTTSGILYFFDKRDEKYPNVDAVIPRDKSDFKGTVRIGMNGNLLTKLNKAFGNPSHLVMNFNTENEGVIVEHPEIKSEDFKAIIMPITLH